MTSGLALLVHCLVRQKLKSVSSVRFSSVRNNEERRRQHKTSIHVTLIAAHKLGHRGQILENCRPSDVILSGRPPKAAQSLS